MVGSDFLFIIICEQYDEFNHAMLHNMNYYRLIYSLQVKETLEKHCFKSNAILKFAKLLFD